MYLGLFQQPLTSIGNMLNNFYQSLISADRLNEVYNSKSAVIDHENAVELDEVTEIEFKNFSFKYNGDNFETLNNINLKIKKGETVGIVGKTGSGKSTLVKQLVRQLPIIEGTLFINGEMIESFNQESVRKMVGYVPQEHILFSRSVEENVALGLDGATDEDISNAILLADFEKDIENLPMGLDTMVGEYGVTLSGGQKQRLAIARAFIKNADVLIHSRLIQAEKRKHNYYIYNPLLSSTNEKEDEIKKNAVYYTSSNQSRIPSSKLNTSQEQKMINMLKKNFHKESNSSLSYHAFVNVNENSPINAQVNKEEVILPKIFPQKAYLSGIKKKPTNIKLVNKRNMQGNGHVNRVSNSVCLLSHFDVYKNGLDLGNMFSYNYNQTPKSINYLAVRKFYDDIYFKKNTNK